MFVELSWSSFMEDGEMFWVANFLRSLSSALNEDGPFFVLGSFI